MKKGFSKFITALTVILLIMCWIQMMDLKQQVQNLNNNLNNSISNMQKNLSSNTSYIRDMLEKEASILAKSEWSYDGFDTQTYMVNVKCSVTPKVFDPEITEAFLIYEDREVPMEYENGEYAADIPVYVFKENFEVDQVLLRENGIVRAETLGWSLDPRYEYLSDVYANFSGSTSNEKTGDHAYLIHQDGNVDVEVYKKGNAASIKEIFLLTLLDGKEIERQKLSIDEPAEDVLHGFLQLDKSYEIPYGSTHELWVEVIDQNNLHYQVTIERIQIDEEGKFSDKIDHWNEYETIVSDSGGKVLYKGIW